MIWRLLKLVIAAGLIALLASWLSAQPGESRLDWLGYRLELPTSLLVSLGLGLVILLIFMDRLGRLIRLWPALLGRGWQARRRQRGERALGLGLVALSAGDAKSARRQAKKAEKLLGRGLLPDLLAAQAAHASGDRQAARRYFKTLSETADTAYYGQIGLMNLEALEGRSPASLAAARKALSLQADSAQAARHILEHDLAAESWQAALTSARRLTRLSGLAEGEKSRLGALQAALCYLLSDLPEQAEKQTSWLEQGLEAAPGHAGLTIRLARLLLEKKQPRPALKLLEKNFIRQPHPGLPALIKEASQDNPGQHISRLTKLAGQAGQDSGYLAAASAALDAGIWASASSLLEQIAESGRNNEYFLLQSRLAEARDQPEAAAEALHAAARARHGPAWHCQSCQTIALNYEPRCPSCGQVGSLHWTARPGQPRLDSQTGR